MDPCDVDADCDKYNYCDTSDGFCKHDDVIPIKTIDIVAYVLVGLCLGISNAGGLGAGTQKIFVLMMILNYSQTQATSYTFPIQLAQKLADNIMLLFRKHPVLKEKPLIDFNIVVIFLPSVLLGAAIGSTFNPILPSLALQIIVIVFIFLAFVLTLKKTYIFFQQRKKENLKKQQQENSKEIPQIQEEKKEKISQKSDDKPEQKQKQQPTAEAQTNNEVNSSDTIPKKIINNNEIENKENKQEYQQNTAVICQIEEDKKETNIISEVLQKIQENEKKIPLNKIGVIFTIFILLFILYGFLGGEDSESFVGLEFCGTGYWILFGFQFLIYALFFVAVRMILKKEDDIKAKEGYQLKPFEINYTGTGISKFIINGFMCGLIDGLVGFGGPLMIIPIMVNLGLHSRSATASTSFLTIFSSGITVIIAILSGQVETNALFLLFGVAFVGAFFFTFLINKFIDVYKLDSLTIVFTCIVQLALFSSSSGIFISDLINKDFSDLTSTQSYC